MKWLAIWAMLACPTAATAHPILTFDRAIPAVGSIVDHRTVHEIILLFVTEYDSSQVEVKLYRGGVNIPLKMLHSTQEAGVVARIIGGSIYPGVYMVSWRIHDHPYDDPWHPFKFEAR